MQKINKIQKVAAATVLVTIGLVALPTKVLFAHCPLCTVGTGALAVFAAYLGISSVIVGVLVGALAVAFGLWMARIPKKEYVPYQKPALIISVFLLTIIPLMPLIRDYAPLYISMMGNYGTLLHNTYTINLFLLGVPIGAIIVLIAPWLSRAMTRIRSGKQLPFQGIILTFVLLVIISAVIQLAS